MSTQKNEHNPELYKPDQFTEGDNVVHTTRGWTGKVVSGSTEDRVRVDFGEHNCDFGSGKVPGFYWPTKLRRITPPTNTTGSGREGETAGKAILLPFLVTVLSERHHIGSVTTGAQALIIHASDANSALGIGVKRYKDENPEAAISNTDVVPINMEAMPLVIELRAQVEALRRDGERLDWIETNTTLRWPWGNTVMFAFSVVAAEPFDEQPTLRAAIDSAQRQEGSKVD